MVALPSNFSKITFCLQTLLQKIQVSQAQSNWFSFQGAATYKKTGARRSTHLDMNKVK